jgi:mRNA-degrading endonuclease toxin of MazEF toxin-antitoxin module
VVIRQGDVFWVDLGSPSGSGPGFLHPYVVVQNDIFKILDGIYLILEPRDLL